jgi:hypothetical protein
MVSPMVRYRRSDSRTRDVLARQPLVTTAIRVPMLRNNSRAASPPLEAGIPEIKNAPTPDSTVASSAGPRPARNAAAKTAG